MTVEMTGAINHAVTQRIRICNLILFVNGDGYYQVFVML